jgi:polyribonucleotide nucleotidyltransferase
MIKAIVEQTGVAIDVEDDGTVNISSDDSEAVKKAIAIIESLTTEPEVGTKYTGIVKRIERYGAFIEIAPGKDGLCHITDMAWDYVDNVEALMQLGDEVEVKITAIDREGRIRLSRKELLEKPEGYVERPPREDRGDRGDRGGDRGGDRDRGPRRDRDRGGDRDRGPRRDRAPREGGDRDRAPREGGDREPRRRRRREGGSSEGGGDGGGSAPSGGGEG